MLLNTHCHIDHILGNEFVKQKYNTKLYIHQTEEFVLNAQKVFAPHYGFNRYQEAKPDGYLVEGDVVEIWVAKICCPFCAGTFARPYCILQ